ncbi:MAG: hypothetical protein H7210_01925 [Pyrinomonadaceae bacterium]|nr:hypothetical protein [Phycisphaerales bacterium]
MNQTTLSNSPVVSPAFPSVVVGFDGFVDEIAAVVAERTDARSFRPVQRIADFGDMIVAASGRSFGREFIVSRVEGGGNGPNLAEGLIALGVPVHLYGTLGQPRQPAFDAIAAQCLSCISIGTGFGKTLALEFADGKLMLNETSGLANFDESMMHRLIDESGYIKACRESGLIAFANWSRYPHMTACWRAASRRVLSTLEHSPWVFVDLADPSGRKPAEIIEMLAVVSSFQDRCRVVLGMNLSEAGVLQGVLGNRKPSDDPTSMTEAASSLREHLGVEMVLVHSQRRAAAGWVSPTIKNAAGSACVEGAFVANPVRTTGVGDRFNAGVCAGLLSGRTMLESTHMGCQAGSWFVRTGTNISYANLVSSVS